MNNGTVADVGNYAQPDFGRHRVDLNGLADEMGQRMSNLDSIFAVITSLIIVGLLIAWVPMIILILDTDDQDKRPQLDIELEPLTATEDEE